MRKAQPERIVRQYGGSDLGLFGPDPAFEYNPHGRCVLSESKY